MKVAATSHRLRVAEPRALPARAWEYRHEHRSGPQFADGDSRNRSNQAAATPRIKLSSHGYPAPVARVTTESPLWDWVEVARWMFKRRTISRHVVVEAKIVREANLALSQPDGLEAIFVRKFYQELDA
ncbi:hypothetical protein V1294_002245 [Bradyrhizobium sp. AZCC 1678]|uniref:hypothetical protein n=1 Tax=Bradyrhizobium sp. AZCC 1678 TaxID=3117030 RepID=UPI002FF2EBB8